MPELNLIFQPIKTKILLINSHAIESCSNQTIYTHVPGILSAAYISIERDHTDTPDLAITDPDVH